MKNNQAIKHTIVTLLDTPAYGGAEQYVLDSSEILNRNGHKTIIYTNNEQVKKRYLEFISKNKIKNFKVKQLPFVLDAIGNWKGLLKFFVHAPFACIWLYSELSTLQKTEKNILCWLVGFTDRLALSPIIKRLHIPLIWVDIGPLQPIFTRNWKFPEFLYKLTKKYPDHFTTTSQFTLKSMMQEANICKKNITLVYPGVHTFTQKQILHFKKKGNIWRKKNITAEILVGFVGRMATENEVDLLLTAFAKSVQQTKKRMQLVLIGDGPEKMRFEKLAANLAISDKVIFTGFVSAQKKFSILAACDVFVFSRAWSWDGFGITTIEAMSVGTPVITSNFGPQKEIVLHNFNGIHFKPHDAQDLAKKIILLANSKKLRKKISTHGIQTVHKNFSYKVMEDALLTALKKVIKL